MQRRSILLMIPAWAVARGQVRATVRGRLVRQDEKLPPALLSRDGRLIELEGDGPTLGVLRDRRLKEADFEVEGHFEAKRFVAAPIHTRALYVWRGGQRLVVTYWCDVCAIRAWTPGKCQCCQEEMRLDLRPPALSEMDVSR